MQHTAPAGMGLIEGIFVDEGTSPAGPTWAVLPLPGGYWGPRCICSPDNNYHPGNFDCGCKVGEQRDACRTPGNCSSGACEACPETAGSDCSRCDNPPKGGTSFPNPASNEIMGMRPAVYDIVKVPKVPPGK